MTYQTPHLDKLNAALRNDKLPTDDKRRLDEAIERYHQWIETLDEVTGEGIPAGMVLERMVGHLNDYSFFVEVNLIFDSPNDFLYRQKGQLKLDSSIIEEFLPRLAHPTLIPEIAGVDVSIGPASCYAAAYFESSLNAPVAGGGMRIRTKDQDFAISKRLHLKASHSPSFDQALETSTNLAYIVSECKTNLDKTMFQEACATAHDLKAAVPGARYYLLCEWLDMPPVSTAATDIDEVILLRKAKRLSSSVRSAFSSYQGRQDSRDLFTSHLVNHPYSIDMFQRFIDHIRRQLSTGGATETDVLETGYF